VIALVLLLMPAPALAQSAAEVLVERAVAAYKQGDYPKAGAFFLEAYELSGAPAQLRNSAKAYQKADDLERARDLWRRFSELESIEPSERAEAEAQLSLIEERRRAAAAEQEAARAREEAQRAQVRTATVTVTQPPPQETPRFELPIGPVITLAAAVVVGLTGAGLYYHSDTQLDDLDDRLEITDSGGLIVGIDRLAAEDELDDINRERTIAYALAGVAGAAAIAGVVWWLLDLF
jgi:tetratricopeptide (TPR) repeat protein